MKYQDLSPEIRKNFDCHICRGEDGSLLVFDTVLGFTGYQTLFDSIVHNDATCLVESIGDKEPLVLMGLERYLKMMSLEKYVRERGWL